MLVGMLEALQRYSRNMNTMELIISGAAPVAPELVRAVRAAMNCQFETAFGQTEQSPVICQNWADGTSDDISFSAGQPLPQTEASIRDPETDAILPVDQVGEICARGYGVMLGYHDRPEATAQAIDQRGWLHTGDLGTMDSRGVIRITGRIKDMIIRGGENLFPTEIENALLEHSSVAEVAVVGLPDLKWGEIIGAFVRSEDNRPIDVGMLRQHTRQLLSPQKTPVVWCQVVEFPLTGSGKIQKFIIRDRFIAGEYQEVSEC
jgi:fatty-acyl-CoA synthase